MLMEMLLFNQVVTNILSDFIVHILISFLGTVLFLARYVHNNRKKIRMLKDELDIDQEKTRLEKSEEEVENVEEMVSDVQRSVHRLERYFVGDEDNPSDDGLIVDVEEMKGELQDVRDALIKIEQQSDEVNFDEDKL